MKKILNIALVLMLALVIGVSPAKAVGILTWDQGFEVDTAGWLDDTDYSGYGEIIRVSSGTNNIDSNEGSFHANITQEYPFSRFDGYRDAWTGTWVAQLDVYLDTEWELGSGFDYSVAVTGSDGNHQRDYIFHVTKDSSSGDLLVGGSNNTNFDPREDLENINHYTVSESGWYSLRHTFKEDSGLLAADLQLVDSDGNVLWTETRSSTSDAMSEIGGNRYAWFTAMSEGLNLAIDNHQLILTPPRSAEITAPTNEQEVSGLVNFEAMLTDDDTDDKVQWAVRQGTCAAGVGTVLGNVDGRSDLYTWTNNMFTAEADVTSWTPGDYCFIFNPTEGSEEDAVRETREFVIIDAVAPIITFEEPADGSEHSGAINLKAACNEDCDYVNFWWRAEGESFGDFRYHYERDNGVTFEWSLDSMNAMRANGTTYVMEDGVYYLYVAGKDLAGNWARTPQIMITVNNTPDDMSECKNDGWMSWINPTFKNQGDCVSFVQSNEHSIKHQTQSQSQEKVQNDYMNQSKNKNKKE